MKKKLVFVLLAACHILCITGCGKNDNVDNSEKVTEKIQSSESNEEKTENDEVGKNLIANGDFSNGTEGWNVYLEGGGNSTLSLENGAGKLSILSTGTLNYSNQLYYDGFSLKKGGRYELSFTMSSTVARSFNPRIQINGGDYHAYMEDTIELTEEMQTFTIEFRMSEPTDLAPRLCFNLGTADGLDNVAHTITIDDVCLKLIDATDVSDEDGNGEALNVCVNQVGYRTNDVKTASVKNHKAGEKFTVVDEAGKEVFSGKLTDAKRSEAADEEVVVADFSDLKDDGNYYVSVGEDNSYHFVIDDNVYDELTKDVVRMMYLQRCSMELTDKLAGDFAHSECHTQEAVIYGTNQKKDVSGGWHDAGDYGKYVVTGAQTAADLLLCYEENPDIWSADDLNIPESGNGVPDILDETKYELDWMLKMQDEATGGVWHKVSTYNFPAFIMPDKDTDQLVISPVSTTATGDFAAIMAKASVVYKDIDKGFSDRALEAAKKAWTYLENNSSDGGYKNPSDITTGEYPDGNDMDERYWASVELFKATGDSRYQTYFENQIASDVLTGYGWIEMGTYGNISYLSMDDSMKKTSSEEKIKNTIIAQADEFVSNAQNDGYGCCLSLEGYNWGSNLGVCNNARTMLLAGKLSGDEKYIQYAKDQLDYLLGKNSLSISFVTGYGEFCSKDVHHRPSVVNGQAMKGMLVGGPNSGIEDPYAANVLKDLPPAKCYADNQQSYATNEVTIYWNSPFACLLTELLK